jgi:hypothetical protein
MKGYYCNWVGSVFKRMAYGDGVSGNTYLLQYIICAGRAGLALAFYSYVSARAQASTFFAQPLAHVAVTHIHAGKRSTYKYIDAQSHLQLAYI